MKPLQVFPRTAALLGCLATVAQARAQVTEFAIAYPDRAHDSAPHTNPVLHGTEAAHAGSTHEITFDERRGGDLWITGQNHDALVRVTADGRISFRRMPEGSGPHGIEFDAPALLWVTLEFHGRVVAFDRDGRTVHDYDVRLDCSGCPEPINTHPHGLAVAPDGQTVWFTGKGTGTVGRITPDGKVRHYALPTAGSVPIYIRPGPDGNLWVTELAGNKIARVTPEGGVAEFAIPPPTAAPSPSCPGPTAACGSRRRPETGSAGWGATAASPSSPCRRRSQTSFWPGWLSTGRATCGCSST
jgi:streptogramin lyase